MRASLQAGRAGFEESPLMGARDENEKCALADAFFVLAGRAGFEPAAEF